MKRTVVTLFGLCNLFALTAQLSPGELSQAHAHLEGVTHCTQCHSAGNKVTNDNCLKCHTIIKANQQQHKGYHGSAEVLNQSCSTCHNEHHGRLFRLKNFNKATFDHKKTGFELKGVHAKQSCTACHKLKNKKESYLGLNPSCLSCHDDYHQGKMSSSCTDCHSFDNFTPTKPFDHSTTGYPLKGKHKQLSCNQCHKPERKNGHIKQGFSGLSHSNCTPCHVDVHKNKFGQDCKRCHTETSFHISNEPGTFNHDQTGFPLLGKHRTLACKACHTSGDMTKPLKHDACTDCHKDVEHKGEFAVNGRSPDCKTCHTNDGFEQTNYTIEQHNKGSFPLSSAHQATACTACHKKTGEWHFRQIGRTCVDCHKDEHKGYLPQRYYGTASCTSCHEEGNWMTIHFDHTKTSFPLDGKHATLACRECHYKTNEQGVRVQRFAGLSRACSSCHKDHHAGQFEENGVTDCKRCHRTSGWKPTTFNHDNARFKLDGAHKQVACESCHKPITTNKGTYIQYKLKSIECSSCHS